MVKVVGLVSLLFFLVSCVNQHADSKAEKNISSHLTAQQKRYQLAKQQVYSKEQKELRWQQALDLMLRQNRQLLTATETLRTTRKVLE